MALAAAKKVEVGTRLIGVRRRMKTSLSAIDKQIANLTDARARAQAALAQNTAIYEANVGTLPEKEA